MLTLVSSAALAVPANAATATDLYVAQRSMSCLDTGPGTQNQPFCTVQAAADVALPGQTVHVDAGDYAPVTITRSGSPGTPITFVSVKQLLGAPVQTAVGFTSDGYQAPHAFTVTGSHDIVISTFDTVGTAGAFVIDNSSRVTVDSNYVSVGHGLETAPTAGVSLTNGSSAVTISRNLITGWGATGVSVGQGVTDSTVTTNLIRGNYGPGVVATDAPGTVVSSNTVFGNCVAGISLGGATTGATVENNIVGSNDATVSNEPNCKVHRSPSSAEIVVAAGSTDGTVVDYNLTHPLSGGSAYSWGGVGYKTSADFHSASGQGVHEMTADPKFAASATLALAEGSPAIDSGDPTAPGELPTDLNHAPRVDDPLAANASAGFADRGASELQDPFQLKQFDVSPTQGPSPLPVTLKAEVDDPWSTQPSYTFEFGDGSAPVTTGSLAVQHTYEHASDSSYETEVTVNLPAGVTRHAANLVKVTTPAPPVAKLTVRQVGPLTVDVDARDSTDPWAITEYDYDHGDGSPVIKSPNGTDDYTYATPGTYTITMTMRDGGGNATTTSRQVTVGGAYVPAGPQRLLDTRDGSGPVGPGGQTSVQVTGTYGVPTTGVTAVVLNVTATGPTADSFLSVYPSGGANPGTSNVNFGAGQTVPNLVTVPVGPDGKVVIANHSGSVDVVVDLQGYYQASPAARTGNFLTTVQPRRVMDTRDGTGGVPQAPVHGTQVLNVMGLGSAVVLNVTVTNASTDSFLTVSPDGVPTPTASNLNYRAGQTTSNLVIVPVPMSGKIDVTNHFGSADVIADVEGSFDEWYATQTPSTAFMPLAPSRLLDTRDHATPVGPNGTLGLSVAGVGSVPAYAKSVVLNVTVVNPTASSFLTVFPSGDRPSTSNLNFGAGQITQGQVIVPIGPDGKVDFYNLAGTVDVVADVFGYFA
ncbi:hypothetical protein GCM10018954_090650 [Kutzneria kofuensis]